MFFFTLFLWVVAFVLSEVLRPKPKNENQRPAHLGDFNFPTATEGRVLPLVWGTVKISGPNVVWYGDLVAKAIKKKVKTGIFSSTNVLQGFKYYVGIQFALCRGTVDSLKKLWIGDKLVFDDTLGEATLFIDEPKLFGGEGVGNGGVQGNFSFYLGTRTQLANSYLDKTPSPYLWYDDYSQGEPLNLFQLYKKTEPEEYYRVSQNGSLGFGPTTNLTNTNIETATHVRAAFVGTTPGDINKYCCLLQHEARPRLADNIKIAMTFVAKDQGAADGGAHRLWMGCRLQDTGTTINSNEGVFLIVESQSEITIRFQSPSTSGAYILMHTLSVTNGDFSTLTGTHQAELHLEGSTVSVYVDGLLKYTGTDSRISTISDQFRGFCIGIEGNANVEFFTATDWSAVGIYTFGIDDLTRVLTSSVPAFRGVCYGVYEKGYIGNSTSISPWAFEIQRIDAVNGLAVPSGHHKIFGTDLNPMCALYEILTDPDWGLAFADANIDLVNFRACAETLWNENNGFSMIIDSPTTCQDLIGEIERQIDGYLYCDRVTNKWKVTLARNDYVVADLDLADASNVIEVSDFTRGAWEETTNNVLVEYSNRGNDYGVSYGAAQDMANIRLQAGQVVTASEKYPGVKNRKTANNIAWRDLRALAYPLAKCTLIVDRTFHDKNPGDLLRWSDTRRNIANMAMRIQRIDLGQLDQGQIKLNLIQDVFGTDEPSFGDPDNTQWIIPSDQFPLNIDDPDRLLFEAPRKFVTLAPENAGLANRIWVGARAQPDNSSRFDIIASTGGAYSPAGSVEGFLYAGELTLDLTADTVNGTTYFELNPIPDSLLDLVSELEDATADEIGTSLSNLLLVGDEIIGFESVTADVDSVNFTNVYRGLLDTVPALHPAGTKVWLICTNGNLTDTAFSPTGTVSIKLLPQNARGQLSAGVSSPTSITLDRRYSRPYPPTELLLNTVRYDDTVSMDLDFGASISVPFNETFPYSNGSNLASLSSGFWSQEAAEGSDGGAIFFNSNRMIMTGSGVLQYAASAFTTVKPTYDPAQEYSVEMDVTLDNAVGGSPTGDVNFSILFETDEAFSVFSSLAKGQLGINTAVGLGTSPLSLFFSDNSTGGLTYDMVSPGVPIGTQFHLKATVHADRTLTVEIDGTAVVWQFGRTPMMGDPAVTSQRQIAYYFQTGDGLQYIYVDNLQMTATVAGSLDQRGIKLDYTRRDYRNADEVAASLGETFTSDFPLLDLTKYTVDVRNDPNGANTLLYTMPWNNGEGEIVVRRSDVLQHAAGIPTRLRVAVRTKHTVSGTEREALQKLTWDFDVTSSALSGGFYFGNLAQNITSNTYTATHTGTYRVDLGTAFASGTVEYRLNGGSWTTVCAATVATGTFAATTGDTINVRHTQSGSTGSNTIITLTDLTDSNLKAYGTFTF